MKNMFFHGQTTLLEVLGLSGKPMSVRFVQLLRHLFSGYVDYIGEELGLDGMKAAQGDRFLHEVRGVRGVVGWRMVFKKDIQQLSAGPK